MKNLFLAICVLTELPAFAGNGGIIGIGKTGGGGAVGAEKQLQIRIPVVSETLFTDATLIPITVSTSVLPLKSATFLEVKAALQEEQSINLETDSGHQSYQVANFDAKTITLFTDDMSKVIIINAE